MDAPLLIADVPWLLYRAFFSLPKSIKGADGKPVNALLGTVNALLAASEAQPPRAVVACFGAEEARYRVEAYPPYHAHRDAMPAELREQWGRAPDLLASFGWTIADADELEADDAMGSFARVEAQAGGRALLLTADRDLYQCVNDNVAVLDLGKGGACSVLGPSQVHERYGIAPGQVPDFIALRGDPSDGLPGAPGIGAKTAAELLRVHDNLEALLEQAKRQCEDDGSDNPEGTPHSRGRVIELRPRVAQSLHENAELLRTFKRVATLVELDVERPSDIPTDFAGGAAKAREIGMERLAARLDELAVAAK
ncbi:MAG TPA: 5'-3' exonuclease H3TH domain-containing protein [Solirubrobacteraceae bacterium]|jgi:5'-3' exonuclease|nr:5'-3' exonuclease H3TH domain-containing protein [Solirubrobacteraceae bacterium]